MAKIQQTNLDSLMLQDNETDVAINKQAGHKRWLILALFSAASLINGFHWIYLASISNLAVEYYKITTMMVNMTSLVYMFVYIVAIIPALFFTERFGLRQSIVMGTCGNMLAIIIKLFSSHADHNGFSIFMLGQLVASASQLFMLGMPPLIATLWFPQNLVATANAIGVFSNQLGIAMGFLIPVWLLGDNLSGQNVQLVIEKIHSGLTMTTMVVTLLIWLLFEDKQQVVVAGVKHHSRTPTSENNNKPKRRPRFTALVASYFHDKGFPVLILSYGICVGASYAFSTLLNQLVLPKYPDGLDMVARLGLVFVVSGMAGCLVSGPLIDHTRAYKLINLIFTGLGLVSYGLFAFAIQRSQLILIHLATGALGFLITAQLVIGTETANQLCKPKPENIASGLLNQFSQIFGIIFTVIGSKTAESFGPFAANLFFMIVILFGFVFIVANRSF